MFVYQRVYHETPLLETQFKRPFLVEDLKCRWASVKSPNFLINSSESTQSPRGEPCFPWAFKAGRLWEDFSFRPTCRGRSTLSRCSIFDSHLGPQCQIPHMAMPKKRSHPFTTGCPQDSVQICSDEI